MATVELEPDRGYPETVVGINTARRPLFPAIRWGAIFAGVAVGVSIQLVLALLGIATGLTSVDVGGDNPGARSALIWTGISMLISAFIGGYVAARMSNLKRKVDGILHGAVSWAVTTLMFAVLATSVTGSLLGSVFGTLAPAARSAVMQGGNSPVVSMLQREIGSRVDKADMQRLQRDIQAGRRDDAIQLMTTRMGVNQARAQTIVDQALIVSGSPEQASPQARQNAQQAVNNASKAAWGVFIAVALSLAVGIGGGVLGAMSAKRVNWSATGMTPRTA